MRDHYWKASASIVIETETYWTQLACVMQVSAIFVQSAKTPDISVTEPIISNIFTRVMLGSKHQETCTIYLRICRELKGLEAQKMASVLSARTVFQYKLLLLTKMAVTSLWVDNKKEFCILLF